MLKVLIKASAQCGLQINKDQSIILIYDQKTNYEGTKLEGITVAGKTCLGIKLINTRNIFKE